MNLDISHILDDWPYEPGQVTARRIRGKDGRDKIQLRLDLGILQMETTGRPDGAKPHGHETVLAYYQHKLQEHTARTGQADGFELDSEACELLRAEGVMFYHRYLAEFILEDFEGVERDTVRNLRLFDFCRAYAADESDRYVMEQYRPYVIMMCARARARAALRDDKPQAAMSVVRKGIEELEEFYESFGSEKLASGSGELAALRALGKEVEMQMPVDPLQKLHRQLDAAVAEERYEDAADIRDQLRRTAGEV